MTLLRKPRKSQSKGREDEPSSKHLTIAPLTAWDGWAGLILSAGISLIHTDSRRPFPDQAGSVPVALEERESRHLPAWPLAALLRATVDMPCESPVEGSGRLAGVLGLITWRVSPVSVMHGSEVASDDASVDDAGES